ncbi:MAG: SAM-dependent methyltransferase, partial [Pseudonocardiaceae bacterium]
MAASTRRPPSPTALLGTFLASYRASIKQTTGKLLRALASSLARGVSGLLWRVPGSAVRDCSASRRRHQWEGDRVDRPGWASGDVDLEHPSAARVYDYYLGGSHNFA